MTNSASLGPWVRRFLLEHLARLRLRPTSPEGAPVGHQKYYTSVIAEQAAGG